MAQVVWRIAADTATYAADDLSGTGAKMTGGRWNAVGQAVVYASCSRALACLETMVHLNAGGLPLNRYLVEIAIPDELWAAAQREEARRLPVGWDAMPPSLTSTGLGGAWLAGGGSAVMLVPSVVVPEEFNVLINPAHPAAAGLKGRKVRKWVYDGRAGRG